MQCARSQANRLPPSVGPKVPAEGYAVPDDVCLQHASRGCRVRSTPPGMCNESVRPTRPVRDDNTEARDSSSFPVEARQISLLLSRSGNLEEHFDG